MPAPYDTFYSIMTLARVRLNDAINTLQPVTGQLIKNTQDFSRAAVNAAWRKLQERLADMKYSELETENSFIAVPPTSSTDPLVQNRWDFSGYFDGTTLFPAFALPTTLIRPYILWERQTGTLGNMLEMDDMRNGLPSIPKAPWNRQWQWNFGSVTTQSPAIFLPGSLNSMDVRMRYAQYYPDPADNSPTANTPWYGQPAPIMRCADALADYMCREICIARGDMDMAIAFQASAEANAALIINRDTAQPSAILKASEFYRMADKFTPVKGKPTPTQVGR